VVLIRNFKNIFLVPELRQKLMFTVGVLAVYRFGVHIPIPGINVYALGSLFKSGLLGNILSYLDLFAGGALSNFAIFALGIVPYINASIMMQVLTLMLPSLEALAKEGEYGRQKINQYTRYLTLAISVIHGFGAATMLESQPGIVLFPGWGFRITTMFILSVGALFVMWLGEQINSHGIGNGSSIVIFAGIVAGLPAALIKLFGLVSEGEVDPLLVIWLGVVTLAVILCIIFLEKGERRVPVQYAKRIIGHRVYGGQSSYIPLKLNPSGVIPVIFAQAFLVMIVSAIGFIARRFSVLSFFAEWFNSGPVYFALLAALIIFFSFFYTAIIFNPVELADNIRKSGGFIPGIRPGKKTAEFFDYLLVRLGFPGSLYLATLAIVPGILRIMFHFPLMFSGISLLIVIGVAMDTSAQIEAYLIERRYEGFLSTGRLKGRFGR